LRFSDVNVECDDDACCMNNQNPNPTDGNSYLEFDALCKSTGPGGNDCVDGSGCRLCFKPVLGGVNVGNRPICGRFENMTSQCDDDGCCIDNQNPNPDDGNGFQEFEASCKFGGEDCIADSGCRLCFKPVFGGINVGNRPICDRFKGENFTNNGCNNDECCLDRQNGNPTDGNGFLEFDDNCFHGGLNCVGSSGCKLCFKPVFEGINVGNRPICDRFLNFTDVCDSDKCCVDHQNPNPLNGNGYFEFDSNCLNGGLNCVGSSGCKLCFKPVFGSVNVGERPVCDRFLNMTNSCNDDNCCINHQNANPTDGNGYLEFDSTCNTIGGPDCVSDSGCKLCFKPVIGGVNVGNRAICDRFKTM